MNTSVKIAACLCLVSSGLYASPLLPTACAKTFKQPKSVHAFFGTIFSNGDQFYGELVTGTNDGRTVTFSSGTMDYYRSNSSKLENVTFHDGDCETVLTLTPGLLGLYWNVDDDIKLIMGSTFNLPLVDHCYKVSGNVDTLMFQDGILCHFEKQDHESATALLAKLDAEPEALCKDYLPVNEELCVSQIKRMVETVSGTQNIAGVPGS